MKNKLLLFSIIEALYINHMFFVYKSNYNFDNYWFISSMPLVTNIKFVKKLNITFDGYFNHNMQHSNKKESFICQFGKDIAKLAIYWLIIRSFVPKIYKKYNIYIVGIALLLCYLNFNALVYSIPIILVEYYLYRTL